MNDKDEIKELFQKELGNYQAKVNPNLWNGIQAGLGNAGAATGAASSLGLVGKIIIGVSIAATATIGTLLIVNNKEKLPKEEQIITELKSEDSVNKESVDELNYHEEITNNSSTNDESSIVKDINKEDVQDQLIDNSNEKIKSITEELPSKEVKTENSKNSISQENTIFPQNKADQKNTNLLGDNKTIKTAPIVDKSTVKEDRIYELAEVSIQIKEQKNQYISFITEGVPSNVYVVWDFGDGTVDRTLNPEHFYAEKGIYDVNFTVKTATEEVTKNIQVEIKILGEIGDLPNVFTPNGDGNNDEFFVNCKNIKNFQLTIIDNHQNIIYSTNDVDFRWNGFDKSGQAVKDGTYYYIIVAEDESGNIINKYQQLRLHR